MTRYHTTTGIYESYLESTLKIGRSNINLKTLRLFSELTGIDGFANVTVWGSHKYNIINPKTEIPDQVWGELYGIMLARLKVDNTRLFPTSFILHNIDREGLQNHIEKLGKLNKKLSIYTQETVSGDLQEIFGKRHRQGSYESYTTRVPTQVSHLVKSVKVEDVSPEFARHALFGYAMLRGRKRYDGYNLRISIDNETTVRTLGVKAGASISGGYSNGTIKYVYLRGLNV